MNYRDKLLRNDIKKLKAEEKERIKNLETSNKEKDKQINELKKKLKAWEKADFLKLFNLINTLSVHNLTKKKIQELQQLVKQLDHE